MKSPKTPPGPHTEQRAEHNQPAADHPPLVTGSQSQKRAIAAPERHYLPNCKQASLLTKTSWGSGQSTSTCEGAPVVHPENRAAGTGEALSYSDHAWQTPHHPSCSELGRAQNTGPKESAPLRTTQVPEPELLRPGRLQAAQGQPQMVPGGAI